MTTEVKKYNEEEVQAVKIQQAANAIEIKNEEDFKQAVAFVQINNATIDKLDSSELGIAKENSYAAYKQINKAYKIVADSVEGAKETCLSKMKAYLEGRKTEPEDDRLYYRETWSAKVTDIKALCRAVAEGELPEDMVKPNATALNKLARSMKDLLKADGIEAVSSTSLCFRKEQG